MMRSELMNAGNTANGGKETNAMKNITVNTTENKQMSLEELGSRVFAKGVTVSNNPRATKLNNNDLLVGTAGSGKTGGYVVPNLRDLQHSLVVVDAKSQLYKNYSGYLRRRGFRVENFNFVRPEQSAAYNPMDYIERTWEDEVKQTPFGEIREKKYGYREEDLMSIVKVLVPDDVDNDSTFWGDSARNVIVSLMAYCLEVLPRKEQHMGSVCRLYDELTEQAARNGQERGWMGVTFFTELEAENPDSFAVRMYHKYSCNFKAEKCWSSITQFVANALSPFEYSSNAKMFNRRSTILFPELGRQKTVLFVNISDTDRSMDNLVNLFYTQLFKSLCMEADFHEDGRLAVPVRIVLDDFASNVCIPNFDKIISNIRSREIYATVILQSISQLSGMYKEGQAQTIINNCDHMLYLGGQDVETARFFATKSGKLPETILEMPLTDAWFFERGSHARQVAKVEPYAAEYLDPEPNQAQAS